MKAIIILQKCCQSYKYKTLLHFVNILEHLRARTDCTSEIFSKNFKGQINYLKM